MDITPLEGYMKNYRIRLFNIVTMLFWFAMYTYVPILGVYIEQLGGSNKMVGIIVGSYGFAQMLLRIPIGVASDKLRKRKLFINFGLFFTFFSGIGLYIFKDLNLILVFRAFAGAAAATWVDFTILYTSYYRHDEAPKAIGIINFYNSLAQMLAMLVGGWFAENINYKSTFLLGAFVGIIGLIASLFIIDNHNEKSQGITPGSVVGVIRDKNLLASSSLAVLLQLLAFSTVYGFTPLYAASIGATKFDLGLLTVASSLPGAAASLIGGTILARKIGEKTIIISGFLLMGAFTLSIPFTAGLPVLIITQAFAGIGRGLSFPMLMSLCIKHVNSDRRATAMGFFQSIYGLGMFLGPVLTGIIGDAFNLRGGFIILGIMGIMTACASFFCVREYSSLSHI